MGSLQKGAREEEALLSEHSAPAMALTVPTARVDLVISKDEQLRIFKPFNSLGDNVNSRHLKHYPLLFSQLMLFVYVCRGVKGASM